jgi:molybdate transport system ATP-binding protein
MAAAAQRLGTMTLEARFALQRGAFTLDVDLALPPRGVTALFGPSGSGKTTLLRCIAGLERAQGRLAVDGEVWQDARQWRPPHRRPLGFVFQEASLFPHLSVRGNLHYGLKRAHRAHRADGASLDQAIALLGIGHLLERSPEGLSGGERQRVAIARALAVGPRLLLLDEPLASLDAQRKQEILPYLERLHAELRIPMFYVSHAPDEVARLADHLVVLAQGRVQAQGPLAETVARLDLPLQMGEDRGVVLQARVAEIDTQWHLARLAFDGGHLWLPDHGLPTGRAVRVRVLARDVSLARHQPAASSIQNVLPGTLEAVADDAHPGLVLVRLRVGPTPLLARLTRRSLAALDLQPGRAVWVQVKTVALMD